MLFMGKSTISMAIFNSYVSLPEGMAYRWLVYMYIRYIYIIYTYIDRFLTGMYINILNQRQHDLNDLNVTCKDCIAKSESN